MVQLPGRISIRPLAQFHNRPQTHKVALQDQKMQMSVKYPYQTLTNSIDYKDISNIKLGGSDNLQADPLSKNIVITTKHRQLFEIPEMETVQAMKLKEAIETQQTKQSQKREEIAQKSPGNRVSPMMKFRR